MAIRGSHLPSMPTRRCEVRPALLLCLSTSYHLSSFSSHLNCCLTLPRCSPVDSAGLLSCKSGPGYIGPDGGAFTPCPKGTIQSLSLLIKIVGNHSRVHACASGRNIQTELGYMCPVSCWRHDAGHRQQQPFTMHRRYWPPRLAWRPIRAVPHRQLRRCRFQKI